MHFKKILSVTVLAASLMFTIPAVVHADEPAGSTEQTVVGWGSDAIGSFYTTSDGTKATGFSTSTAASTILVLMDICSDRHPRVS